MKRFLLLAAVVGGLTLGGFSSTANAAGWYGGRDGWGGGGGGYGHCGAYGGYRGAYGYGYNPYVGTRLFLNGPRFNVAINPGFGYGFAGPYNRYGSVAYPPAFYGW